MVLQGLDVLESEGFELLKGKRVALVINYSFVDSKFRSGLDLMLNAGVNVVRIFTPEHGLFSLPDGKRYEMDRHPEYDIQVTSLYGKKLRPDREDLEGVDAVVYDIQDVGLRYYTFIYTMAYVMEECEKLGVEFIVLDRVNPLGRKVRGGKISKELESFVGGYGLATRYGLTPGELAMYFKRYSNLDIDLSVVELKGWSGETFEKTGLYWNVPSPNLPTFESVIAYAGMCFLEATNLSEGRGTTKPFQYVGAPWMDSRLVYEELKKLDLKDVIFRKREFIPRYSKYEGEVCWGIEFVPTSSNADFFEVALHLISILLRTHEEFEVHEDRFNRLVGDRLTLRFLEKGDVEEVFEMWKRDEEEFKNMTEDLLLY